ncbi:MAG TPA: LPS export ABC transporter periplasmic protein LptC [Chitinophagaceae bacterium]|nr:LPS export ABC transporter periplasmic protein LptC [Chitinophagaceae bacterium]
MGILFLGSILFFLTSCENDLNDLPDFNKKITNEDIAVSVEIIISEMGKSNAHIFADTLKQKELIKTSYTDLIGNVKLIFLSSDSTQEKTTIIGDFARLYSKENNAIIRNNVIVSTEKGDSLLTEELIWNDKLKQFFTDKDVTIVMDGETSYGKGLEANEDLSWIRVYQQKGAIPFSSEEFISEEENN